MTVEESSLSARMAAATSPPLSGATVGRETPAGGSPVRAGGGPACAAEGQGGAPGGRF